MTDTLHKKYIDSLRGNQDVFLIDTMRSPEFQAIKKKHLANVFTGIYGLLRKVDENDESGQKVLACADEVSDVFKISKANAVRLLLTPSAPAVYGMQYTPLVQQDGSDILIRIGQKTTREEVMKVWKYVKDLQKMMGGSGSKTSINPELAFCVHRQYVLKGRKMKDIFDDYRQQKLEGYDHSPTIEDEDEFRKRYNKIVKGL
ncbi:MAG: hypothetical protein ACM3KF_01480 [Acidobacteriota bacterium]